MKHILLLLMIIIVFTSASFSQKWVEMMQNNNANFYKIQKEFNHYWKDRTIEKGKGWKQFKRWEYFWKKRVFPTGEFPAADITAKEFLKFKQQKNNFKDLKVRSNWTPLGPFSWNTTSYNPGIGRINCVEVHPQNADVIFVGAPSGGLWKSEDGGLSWTTTTDDLPVLGVTSIAIDPLHPDTMYMASGDGDAGDTYSLGVLKSVDGGETWTSTGLDWSNYTNRRVSKILIDPADTDVIIAATGAGIHKSVNGGADWYLVQNGNFKDMEYKPGDNNVIYACGTYFYRSVDGGEDFDRITSGLPSSSAVNRLAIAVTQDNPELVYAVAGDASNSSFYGFYRSNNGGESFTEMATSPNLLGYELNGSDAGGQSWYDLAIAASPTDSNEVYVGGVNIWKTQDGGTNWVINTHWYYYTSSKPYVHADIHDLIFFNNVLYSGSDGGIFRTMDDGATWDDLSAGLATTQFYRFGLYPDNENLIIGGTQDNGTNRYNSGIWTHVIGGDGMEALIDYSNPSIMYASYYYGDIMRSTNGGYNFTNIKNNITESGDWVTPFGIDPVNPEILFAGFSNVWKTENRGDSWTKLSDFSGGKIQAVEVASSNPSYIYAAKSNAIYRTADGGSIWENITPGLPSAYITYIAIASDDPLHIWITFSGYYDGEKIYESFDGGDTWQNYSEGLPNIPVNCVTFQSDHHHALYLGTDVGVYYRDSTLTEWEPFMEGLPNVIVRELEIHYATQVVRTATYGRGIWESPLQSVTAVNETNDQLPSSYQLMQNHPNPFNPSTTINYQLPLNAQTRLVIYNALGQQVRVLTDKYQTAGVKSVIWDGKNDRGEILPGGIYIYRIQSGNFIQSRKMMLVK